MSQFIQFESAVENPNFPPVQDITVNDVVKNKEHITLIDVRTPDEYEGELGHIEGAQLIPLQVIMGELEKIPKDKTVVLICRSGQRSAAAGQALLENGFESVYNMQGGMIAWNEQNAQ